MFDAIVIAVTFCIAIRPVDRGRFVGADWQSESREINRSPNLSMNRKNTTESVYEYKN